MNFFFLGEAEDNAEDKTPSALDASMVAEMMATQSSRRGQKAAETAVSRQIQRLSSSANLPHSNSGMAKCIQDFVKAVLGISNETGSLPLAPTSTEIIDFEERQKQRETLITEAIQEIRTK